MTANQSINISRRRRFTRRLLLAAVGALALAGALGLFILSVDLSHNWNRPIWHVSGIQGRIRITMYATVAAIVLTCANAAAFEYHRFRVLAVLGMAASVTAWTMAISEIWGWWEWGWQLQFSEMGAMGVLWVLAAACALIALLTFSRVPRMLQWVISLTHLSVFVLGALLMDITWFGRKHAHVPFVLADMAALVVAGCVVVIAVLHVRHILQRMDAFKSGPLTMIVNCPRCRISQEAQVGRSTCSECSLELRIELGEAYCEKCGYPLYKLPGQRCPECGMAFARHSPIVQE